MAKYVPWEKMKPTLSKNTDGKLLLGGWAATIGGAIGAACSKGIVGKVAWIGIAWLGNLVSSAAVLDYSGMYVEEYAVELPDPEEEEAAVE